MEAGRIAERKIHRLQLLPARDNAKIKSEEAFATLLVPANQRVHDAPLSVPASVKGTTTEEYAAQNVTSLSVHHAVRPLLLSVQDSVKGTTGTENVAPDVTALNVHHVDQKIHPSAQG